MPTDMSKGSKKIQVWKIVIIIYRVHNHISLCHVWLLVVLYFLHFRSLQLQCSISAAFVIKLDQDFVLWQQQC